MALWFACRVTSDRKSVQYGIRFSYPLYITIVALGIYLVNPFILSATALLAFLGVILPMHPFDYLYNYGVAKLIGTAPIPGRGSELQVNSVISLFFNLAAVATILYELRLNYVIMALMYVFISIFFIVVLLRKDKRST